MLSIIICSKHKVLPASFLGNIDQTVGVAYEIVCIDNSENKYSIFSAYNLGVARSQYPFLCLVHEDVYFHTENWGNKVIKHLSEPKTGIVGIAGGNLVSSLMFDDAQFIVPWGWMGIGLVVCISVGLLSGFYPAYKASKLDPIESLRYE